MVGNIEDYCGRSSEVDDPEICEQCKFNDYCKLYQEEQTQVIRYDIIDNPAACPHRDIGYMGYSDRYGCGFWRKPDVVTVPCENMMKFPDDCPLETEVVTLRDYVCLWCGEVFVRKVAPDDSFGVYCSRECESDAKYYREIMSRARDRLEADNFE